MSDNSRWRQAQSAEQRYWDQVSMRGLEILRVLINNQERAERLTQLLPVRVGASVEMGIGPLGIGVSAFLTQVKSRVGIEPLGPIQLLHGDARLLAFVNALRQGVCYVRASGEHIPIRSQSADLAICANVLDHVSDAGAVLGEIYRVLKPGGFLYLEVDTFSIAGLAKWYLWTSYRHRNEIMVEAHPYRFRERTLTSLLNAQGFEVLRQFGHTRLGNLWGRSQPSTFFAVRA